MITRRYPYLSVAAIFSIHFSQNHVYVPSQRQIYDGATYSTTSPVFRVHKLTMFTVIKPR